MHIKTTLMFGLITLSLLIPNIPRIFDHPPHDSYPATSTNADSPARYVNAAATESGDGLSWTTAWQTISEAATADLPPGTVIHIGPGIYRETVAPQTSGTIDKPITFKAEAGPGTVYIVGSETAKTLNEKWQPLTAYTGTLPVQPGVDANAIHFVVADWLWEQEWDNGNGIHFPIESDLLAQVTHTEDTVNFMQITRLIPAREPDWMVNDRERVHENWWAADGGAAGLSATTPTDSNIYLMDTGDDASNDQDGDSKPDFPNIPPGNLRSVFTTDNDFADPRIIEYPGDTIRQEPLGATIMFNDGHTAHYTHRLLVKAYNATTGVLRVINPIDEGPDGQGHQFTERTKFYVEGTPRAMDCPGEWVHYDGRIFILTGKATDAGCGITLPAEILDTLEIAQRFTLLHIADVSHLRFEGLNFAFNNYAKYGYHYDTGSEDPYPPYLNYPLGALQVNADNAAVQDVVFDNITLEHTVTGLYMGYPNTPSAITLRNSTFRHIDGTAIELQAPDEGGLEGIVIEDNHFEDLGFRPQIGEGTGLNFSHVGDFIFKGNIVTNVAHNGVQFHQGWGDYVSRNILVEDNTFDGACRMAYDCGGLKFHGGGKGYEDVLVKHNVSRNQRGWSYAAWVMELPFRQSEPDGWWPHSPLGELGIGIYMDYASGVTLYRNLLVDNSAAGIYYTGNYREHHPNLLVHNTIFGTLDGIHFGNSDNGMPHSNSHILGNIFAKVENTGIHLTHSADDTYNDTTGFLNAQNIVLDHNLYKLYTTPPITQPWPGYNPAWFDPADLEYLTAANDWVPYSDITPLQNKTPWEDNGIDWQTGQSLFFAEGGISPDCYHLTPGSPAIDASVETLPDALGQLINHLEAVLNITIHDDVRSGIQYDIGAFEYYAPQDFIYLPLVLRDFSPPSPITAANRW